MKKNMTLSLMFLKLIIKLLQELSVKKYVMKSSCNVFENTTVMSVQRKLKVVSTLPVEEKWIIYYLIKSYY